MGCLKAEASLAQAFWTWILALAAVFSKACEAAVKAIEAESLAA